MPDVASLHAKLTCTSVLLHAADGLSAGKITGGVLSMLTVTAAVARLPAASTTVPLTCWPAPSSITAIGSGHVATLDPSSVHTNVTVTGARCHPAPFGG